MLLASQLRRNAFRSLRLLDVPAVMAQARFADLRRRYYDRYWLKAAQELGATCLKWDYGYHRLIRNGVTIIVRGPEVRLDDHLTLDLMGNKWLTYQLLADLDVPVPRHVRFGIGNVSQAEALLKSTGRPLVVKPAAGTGGGRGVTTGITDATGLRRAALGAARFDPDLLAEEQIEGHSYRLLFLDGRMIDAIRRDPPRVTGDGRKTIQALVNEENRKRLAGTGFTALSPLELDRDAMLYLAAQKLSPRAVPTPAETVVVKRAVNQNSAAENHVVRTMVHPATVALCARLVTRLGVRLAGVDIIAHDISAPLERGNGLIGEINTTPGLHHHDLVAEAAEGPSVAAMLAKYLLDEAEAAMDRAAATPSFLRVVAG